MNILRRAWNHLWGAGIGVGGGCGVAYSLMSLPEAAIGGLSTIGVVCGAGLTAGYLALKPPMVWSRVAWAGVASGVGLVAVVGLGLLLGPAYWVVVWLACATAPCVMIYRSSRQKQSCSRSPRQQPEDAASSPAQPSHDSPIDMLLPTDPSDLDDAGLRLAWRQSLVLLQHAASVDERLRVVHVRQAYLDELVRRKPGAFEAWLISVAGAASDPRGFDGHCEPPSHPDNPAP